MQIAILTSDKTSWALRPMFHLLRKYWPQMPLPIVGGYTKPDFNLPALWFNIGRFADYPVTRWSNGLIKFLNNLIDDHVLLMLDDYWLNRPVNHAAIMDLAELAENNPSILRLDVTSDRANNADIVSVGGYRGLDLVQSNPGIVYHFSYQAAIWNRRLLLNVLQPEQSPWESEINGCHILQSKPQYKVIGTRQCPLRYTIAVQQGQLALDGGYQTTAYALSIEDAEYIIKRGMIPAEHLGDLQYA